MKRIAKQVETMYISMVKPSPMTITFVLLLITTHPMSEAQIVSHQLRRLAVSINQFGIDTLKALDRIEPPDKVLVFCPVCLSSSLVMIMMGSSKYQVVSSFRHALYVWSMKPHEINRGFKDIFEHIGLNQQQQQQQQPSKSHSVVPFGETKGRSINQALDNSRGDAQDDDALNWDGSSANSRYLSLPKLMKMKEYLDRKSSSDPKDHSVPWWLAAGRKSPDGGRELKEKRYSNSTQSEHKDSANKHNQRDLGDVSQMSAISNIYVQRGLTMNYNYNLLLRQYYKTVIHPVDFVRNSEETRQHINSLVAANTEGKIKDLVRRETFSPLMKQPKIMIISTFHFRGTLDIQMKMRNAAVTRASKRLERAARNLNLTTNKQDDSIKRQQPTSKGPVFIETEETLLKHGRFRNLDCSVIEIPFINRLVSLVIVMPNHRNGTELLLTKLSAQILSDMINSLVVEKASVEIPVIKFDRGPINVAGVMKELGLDTAFFGDQPHSTETGLNKWMRPSDIVHETSIDIGTINPNWSQTEDRLKVGAHESRSTIDSKTRQRLSDSNLIRLDKPFFYFVLDTVNGLVLTMGRIRQ